MENKIPDEILFKREAFPIKVSDDIVLDLLTIEHAPQLFKLVDKNRQYLHQWLPWLDENTRIEHTQQFINLSEQHFQAKEALNLGIFRENDILGGTGINEFRWDASEAVIGYWLSEDETGKGIMTQCCKTLIDFVFQNHRIHYIEIRCAPENYRSRAIPERLGLKIKETIKNAQWLYDYYVDHVIYKISKQEWEALSKAPY